MVPQESEPLKAWQSHEAGKCCRSIRWSRGDDRNVDPATRRFGVRPPIVSWRWCRGREGSCFGFRKEPPFASRCLGRRHAALAASNSFTGYDSDVRATTSGRLARHNVRPPLEPTGSKPAIPRERRPRSPPPFPKEGMKDRRRAGGRCRSGRRRPVRPASS